MNEFSDFSSVQYAVIKGPHTETGNERIVIAYPDEESLRDLIAAPSILAVGFSTREEAISGTRSWVPKAVAYRQMPEAMSGEETEKHQRRLSRAERRGETGSALRRLGRFLVGCFSDVVTSATVVFSSRDFVSAAIRMALGSSV